MYLGDWAPHFVDAVQREGSKITLEDMADYKGTLDRALLARPTTATK